LSVNLDKNESSNVYFISLKNALLTVMPIPNIFKQINCYAC